jgi:NADH:ubiquinone oxidoreductase subunit 6 (subunit J)
MWLSMIDQDTIAFFVLSALTIGAALLSLETRQVVYGAIALAFSFLGIAGLFIVLDATFVALFQIIVYVGAIAVLIIFTVMVVTKEVESEAKREPFKPLAIAIATIVALAVGIVASLSNLNSTYPPGPTYTAADIGTQLTTVYYIPLIVLGLILGASVVGALTMAKAERS